MSDENRHFERVFADPPTHSDILGHPIEGDGNHRRWKVAGIVLIVACAAIVFGTVVFVAFAFGTI